MRIIKEETPLGATIREIDLRHELSRKEKELIAQALAEHIDGAPTQADGDLPMEEAASEDMPPLEPS